MYTTPALAPCHADRLSLAQALHALHAALNGTDYELYRIIAPTPGRYAVQWRHNWTETSWLLFSRDMHHSLLELTEYIKETIEEIKMNIFKSDRLFPYIKGIMLANKPDLLLTIKRLVVEEVGSQRGSEDIELLYFEEKTKSLILNQTMSMTLIEMFGANTDKWIGKQIYLYAIPGNWGGAARVGRSHQK